MGRGETPFPVPYPTATRPQAWAAATPVLLLQVLLGLEPDPAAGRLVARAPGLPEWAGELRLSGVRALGRSWDVEADGAGIAVRERGWRRPPAQASLVRGMPPSNE